MSKNVLSEGQDYLIIFSLIVLWQRLRKLPANVQSVPKLYSIVKMGVFTDRDQNGDFTITDALFGVEMVGSVIFDVKVQFGFEVR